MENIFEDKVRFLFDELGHAQKMVLSTSKKRESFIKNDECYSHGKRILYTN